MATPYSGTSCLTLYKSAKSNFLQLFQHLIMRRIVPDWVRIRARASKMLKKFIEIPVLKILEKTLQSICSEIPETRNSWEQSWEICFKISVLPSYWEISSENCFPNPTAKKFLRKLVLWIPSTQKFLRWLLQWDLSAQKLLWKLLHWNSSAPKFLWKLLHWNLSAKKFLRKLLLWEANVDSKFKSWENELLITMGNPSELKCNSWENYWLLGKFMWIRMQFLRKLSMALENPSGLKFNSWDNYWLLWAIEGSNCNSWGSHGLLWEIQVRSNGILEKN